MPRHPTVHHSVTVLQTHLDYLLILTFSSCHLKLIHQIYVKTDQSPKNNLEIIFVFFFVTNVATFNPSVSMQNIPILSISDDFPTPGLPLIPILKLFPCFTEFSSKLNNSCDSLECSFNLDSTDKRNKIKRLFLFSYFYPKLFHVPKQNDPLLKFPLIILLNSK